MPDPLDLVRAWRDAAQQLGSRASSAAGQGADVLGALQRQADLVEQVLRRQLEMQDELVRRAIAPAQATVEALENAPAAMRAQASAFRAAAASFTQAAELLELQATALEQTLSAIRAPVHIVERTLARRRDAGE